MPRYACSTCNALRDATRYTKLRKLPPVLHFSLLRFVFDLATLERRKSKHAINFPTLIDMNQFIDKPEGENIYELQGILLHRGSSAYHGHYEAMVREAE